MSQHRAKRPSRAERLPISCDRLAHRWLIRAGRLIVLGALACSESASRGAPGASAGQGSAADGGFAGASAMASGGLGASQHGGTSGGAVRANEGGAAGSGGSSGAANAAGQSGTESAGGSSGSAGSGGAAPEAWVGTWTAAAQLTETANLPPAPGLSHRTLRQIFYVSIGGNRLRVHFSNAYGQSPVSFESVHLALSTSGHSMDVTSDRALLFSGMESVTIPPSGSITSDPIDFALPPQTKVALSIAFGETPTEVTGHPGSRTTSYIVAGNSAAAASLASPTTTDHWYYATGIDVLANPPSAAVVTLGDSITDGRGSTTNGNDRWPDDLSRRLRQDAKTASVAVLNQGLGGNAVLSGGNGPPATQRFERDVLGPAGVRWLIVLHGVNDIGTSTSPAVAQDLIEAYQDLVAAAHGRGIRVYAVPILPFGGSAYDSGDHEAARQTVNAWIRVPGHFDAVLDLEAVVRDPANTARLLPAYDSGDHLHLNASGYQKMADSVDVAWITP